jgi:hypothetical protein
MPNHRQTLGTTSTKQRRKVADQFNARLAASDRRRAHCHMIYQLTKCLQNVRRQMI